ncbi:hypothetical protein RM780_22805 [Streptomyces sp. DSM 44917]|uniref:Transposase n=1 Tax=Streptomyces boetiae TaxID=3075541 RepID=A0ABU2LDV1_9ACTN|nr:hypothetical protein [Streptomyces sp. DSM 44917]MDT0309764.1 hypothetical protein [Streptomyces sp. DSM 44917]
MTIVEWVRALFGAIVTWCYRRFDALISPRPPRSRQVRRSEDKGGVAVRALADVRRS